MVRIYRLPSEFVVPKLRETFMSQFIADVHPRNDFHLHMHHKYLSNIAERGKAMQSLKQKVIVNKYHLLLVVHGEF